ncbi:hypothetical protein, partial [Yokenella regensburgei]|uniref:hypothetical protein n=1 Tax=Yokenella regensburgei TaxID=158877 RepID=UPI003EDA7D90
KSLPDLARSHNATTGIICDSLYQTIAIAGLHSLQDSGSRIAVGRIPADLDGGEIPCLYGRPVGIRPCQHLT